MLQPKKVKRPKMHKVSYEGIATRGNKISFGDFALVSKEGAWITSNQIEAGRIAINKHLKRSGKLWIRIFPFFSMTKKPLEVRMGSGKGSVDKWVAVVKKGTVIFEISKTTKDLAFEALRLASHKLSVKTSIIAKEDVK
ncbi:50S ribosomal protein L16 [symbiont of Argiope bruennichi]|uniref:50S ribosomal protein L16 n=1 Tax=symbiont of Argiope bruennichi TaxID=2810479 RepID=UPI003DA43BD2